MKFAELPLLPALLEAVAAKGYETATPIQASAIPPVLEGHDLVGCAQTGTGKTAAFALPTIQRLMESITRAKAASDAAANEAQNQNLPAPSPSVGATSTVASGDRAQAVASAKHRAGEGGEAGTNLVFGMGNGGNQRNRRGDRNDRNNTRRQSRRKTRALILAPTRELCSQIADSFAAYGKNTPLRYTVIFGGVSQQNQVRALQHGVDAIIATPGRLLDLMQQGHVDLSHVEILILDEADRMLDMGFIHDLRRIVARVPDQRQTLMFSATMPPEIRQLAEEWLSNPVSVAVTPVASTAERIEQSVYFVEKKSKGRLLREWIEKTPSTRTLVFARTKHGADKIVKDLLKSRIFAAAIHGNKSQSQRERALAQFKSTRPPVLVATDIAARGIDVNGISHVINYDLPMEPETYVHRIGRTGRAGATGMAVSFCSVEEMGVLRAIERLTRKRIDPAADHADYASAGQIAPPADEPRQGQRRPNGGGQRRGRRPQNGRPRSASGNGGSTNNGGAQRRTEGQANGAARRTDAGAAQGQAVAARRVHRKPEGQGAPQGAQGGSTGRPRRRRRPQGSGGQPR